MFSGEQGAYGLFPDLSPVVGVKRLRHAVRLRLIQVIVSSKRAQFLDQTLGNSLGAQKIQTVFSHLSSFQILKKRGSVCAEPLFCHRVFAGLLPRTNTETA